MQFDEIPISQIEPAAWNSNEMNESERRRLDASVGRYGPIQPPVVRKIGPERFETISGAQRLAVMRAQGFTNVTCVIVEVSDADARLMSQALNHIHGHENDGLRVAQFQKILESFTPDEVIEILPETAKSIDELLSVGSEDLGANLRDWNLRQSARLHHRTYQLADEQAAAVDRAIEQAISKLNEINAERDVVKTTNPNASGNALHHICETYLKQGDAPIDARYREIKL